MASSPPATAADRLLHCSPARTVVERTDPGTGEPIVVKLFQSGSLAEAERELALGQLAAGPGVVTHLACGTDGATGRPFVATRREDGLDLDRLVAAHGALPAALACELLAPVADTLARLHALRVAAAPAGLCHGDVKPKNLLRAAGTTLLLDFEHAHPVGAVARGPIGTAGFAAPERGAATTTAAHDVHALGATLAWLLAGGAAHAPPQARAVDELLAACRDADARRRPTARDVAVRLRELAGALAQDPVEAVLHDWTTGELQQAMPDAANGDPRVREWRARRRLLERVPALLDAAAPAAAEPAALLTALDANARVLRRFPRHAASLARRAELLAATARLLGGAAQHTAAQVRVEAFAGALEWLVGLEALVRRAQATPGWLPVACDDAAGPGLLQREPIVFVQRLTAQVQAAHAELQDELDRVIGAERRLDLRGAEDAVDAMAGRCGGTSPTAARQRDRLYRLGFYLDRVARAAVNVERMTPLWDATALHPLAAFVAAARQARVRAPRADGAPGTVGLRSLQLTLASIADEFPHLPQTAPALDALTQALAHVTDQAWQLLAGARQQLQASPVPVRPLQLTLGRLDTFRILEAYLDRPQRPRSQLLDEIESLRLALEQARATRDRLAENAESALARGHWTTGLFDMERAVAGLDAPGDEHEREEATRLQQRLQQARQRKQEVEAAVRRNVELASAYGTLQDDAASTFQGRLQVLEERRDCLLFLTVHVPAERSVLYGRDLRDVDTQIALERAGLAERELDATDDPEQRLRLVRATLDQLAASVTQSEQGVEPPGRVVRLLEHWRTVASHCQRAVDQLHAGRALRARQRRRVVVFALAALIATTAAIAFAVQPWLRGEPAMAAGK